MCSLMRDLTETSSFPGQKTLKFGQYRDIFGFDRGVQVNQGLRADYSVWLKPAAALKRDHILYHIGIEDRAVGLNQ